jgi:hypothetical protein
MLGAVLLEGPPHRNRLRADKGVHVTPASLARGAPGVMVFGSF